MNASRLRKLILALIAASASVSVVPAVLAQKPDWKGKILTEGGIRTVVNPAEPLYGKIALDLEEDLRIGKEGDERTQFYRIRDIHADPEGNIYIDDMSNGRVQVFDPKGRFLRTIGRPGQGPGEFEYPTLIRYGGREGHLLVMDRFQRINIFDGRGIFIRSIVPERSFIDFFPDDAGGFVAVLQTGSDEDLSSGQALCRLDANGKSRAGLAKFPSNLHMERLGEGTLLVSTGYETTLYAAPLPGRGMVYGHSNDYELVILGPEDRKVLVIRKNEPQPAFTSQERARFRKVQPKLKPYFFKILTDPKGRIYVQRNMNLDTKRGYGPLAFEDMHCDVFGPDGTFLFRTALPPNARVIGDGYVYGYSVDEDQGLEFAQRFRIKNYADLPII